MTLPDWMSSWRQKPAAVRERITIAPVLRTRPRVRDGYLPLYTYLEHRYAGIVVLTFEQMEALLGCALPARAWTERDWWTSQTSDVDRHSDAWTVARRTATPNLLARTVAFERLP